ncbi:ROK family protein, partial [Pseudactinotalea sp.]|uniref:ROK family transcriptional regulator n=1 Tax=Pseudactinotalea sp. TaxID=1926260 RepID=UPI003B3B8DF6
MTTRHRDSARLRTARSGELLELVRRGHAQTTSELATLMGCARSTVQERVQVLLREGLLQSTVAVPQGRGRPAVGLEFNPSAGVVLAVQVGVSGSRVAITDLATEVLWSDVVDVGISSRPKDLVQAVRATTERALTSIHEDAARLRGIGIGLPGKVELATASPADVGEWLRYPIADDLAERYGVPAYLDQDVNLLALGEQRSSWPDTDVFVCLKVGTVI